MKNNLATAIRQLRIDASLSATLFVPEAQYRQLIEEQAHYESEELLSEFVAAYDEAPPLSQQRPRLQTEVSLLWRDTRAA